MRYTAIALDFDGTIAHDSVVPEPVVDGLRRLKESGRIPHALVVNRRAELANEEVQQPFRTEVAERLLELPSDVLFERPEQGGPAVRREPDSHRVLSTRFRHASSVSHLAMLEMRATNGVTRIYIRTNRQI
jgi:hypothetical protein